MIYLLWSEADPMDEGVADELLGAYASAESAMRTVPTKKRARGKRFGWREHDGTLWSYERLDTKTPGWDRSHRVEAVEVMP